MDDVPKALSRQPLSRRHFVAGAGATAAWVATPAGLVLLTDPAHAQSAAQSRLERMAAQLNLLARNTMAGVAAFVVPGNDLYSLGQGVSTWTAGGVAAKTDAFLVYMFNNYLPLPGASQLATGLGEPFEGIPLPLGDGTTVSLGTAVTEVLSSADSVPLSTLITLLLNALAISVRPSSVVGILPSAFSRLSWRDKAKVFELLELPGSDCIRMVSERLDEPVTKTLIGYIQLVGLGLLAFGASGAYSEWAVIDPRTRTLKSRPVGWNISKYPGVSDGWNEFKGYYQGRRSASDA